MSETEAKTQKASPRKLQKQRREGNIAQSGESSGLLSSAIGVAVFAGVIPFVLTQLEKMFKSASQSISLEFHDALNLAVPEIGGLTVLLVLPFVLLFSITSIMTSILLNGGIVFSMKPVAPTLSRVGIVTGLKRVFGRRGWIEMSQSFIRVGIWLLCAILVLLSFVASLFRADLCGASCVVQIAVLLGLFLVIVAFFVLIISVGMDILVQKQLFLHEQKMTNSEVKQEQSEQFGTREVRQERKRLRKEMLNSADVVGVDKGNMCLFFAEQCIVVRFHPQEAPIPRITAKAATAETTAQMRSQIMASGCPETEDRKLVEGHTRSSPGDPLKQDFYPEFIEALKRMFG
ncbi:MAG: EscU/YscU/HrcU family type III secretion system export apparatus switch protein [Pseudomonadota bacterium]